MSRKLLTLGLLVTYAALITSAPQALGQPSVGLVGGVARESSSGQPVAEVKIVAHNISKGTDRATVTDANGIFAFTDLEPGQYEVAAAKNGFENSTAQVEVTARGAARVELPLTFANVTTRTAGKPGNSAITDREKELLDRIDRLESRLAAMEAKEIVASPAPKDIPIPERTLMARAPAAPPPAAPPTPAPTPTPQAAVNPPPPPAPEVPPAPDLQTPFADHDWTWLNGNSRQHDSPLDSKYFSGEFRADTFYVADFNQPIDHTMGGSSEIFRSSEVQLEDLSIGGDFHAGNMRGRVLALFGMFSATTVRNDASPAVGQWDVRAAYKYISEAYGGYHFNVQHGLNIDAGIFVSYVGLFSYHNFDNWAYQPSYVSSNTPWFFNGVRVQWFPTNHLKIEPWFINGWQSYNRFNGHPGIGGQLKWTPKEWLDVIANQYAVGNDNIGLPNRGRYHTDDSVEVKYFDRPNSTGIDRMAFSFTGDLGCETGQGVTCHGSKLPYDPKTGKGGPKQAFLGWMAYNRFWWDKDLWALTIGGGQMNNPGRYLTLVLPVNGADAISGTPYFPAYPGASMKAYDGTVTLDWMPSQFTTFRWEFGYRHANVPYFSGRGGSTPPGGNNGSPAYFVCGDGATSGTGILSAAQSACGSTGIWYPDLRKGQATLSMMILVKL